MKIILYRDGQDGVAVTLSGEELETELVELLGGETEMVPLNGRLTLVVRKDAEEKRLPIRYAVHKLGRAVAPVPGDCAVIGTGVEGRARDISVQDIQAAECYVRRAGA